MRRSSSESTVSVSARLSQLSEHLDIVEHQMGFMRDEIEDMKTHNAYTAAFFIVACIGMVFCLSSAAAPYK